MPGAYGILEPEGGTVLCPREGISIGLSGRDVMLLPGLAFTEKGERLGYGGGYYDRYLKRYPGVFKAAPAYEFSVLSELPVEEHDERADVLLLPDRIIRKGDF